MTTKKKTKKKAVAKKPATTKQIRKGVRNAQTTTRNAPANRRPDVNPGMSEAKIEQLTNTFINLKDTIEDYAAHMRALDRRRLNGVGVKKQGFIETAYEQASVNDEFLPYWITVSKFENDIEHFRSLKTLYDISRQISELFFNLVMQSSDMAYTDALEYYVSVREAAKRRVDAAETIFEVLKPFFKSHGRRGGDEPTEAEIKRDVNALLRGKKDGEVIVKNFNPKTIKGERKLIDKTFKGKIAYKNEDEGELK